MEDGEGGEMGYLLEGNCSFLFFETRTSYLQSKLTITN